MENHQTNSVVAFEKMLAEQANSDWKSKSLDALESANDLYNKMVQDGLVRKRGYTLAGIEDAHLLFPKFNSQAIIARFKNCK